MKTRETCRSIPLIVTLFTLISSWANSYSIRLPVVKATNEAAWVELPFFERQVGSRIRPADSVKVERLQIKNGRVTLDGLLVLPNLPGKKSVIIFLGGSGEWEIVDTYLKNPAESYGSLTRFYIEQALMRKGYGMLYLNKRGLGRASGKWRKIGIEGRARDALAAFELLRRHPEVNPSSIGMAGHSQGGWVAQLAASQNPAVAFSISFAGPSMSVYDQTLLNDEYTYGCERLSQKKKKRNTFFRKLELGVGGALGKVIGGEAGHWARLRKYNHDAALKNLRSPTLFLFGEYDIYVPPKENLDHLQNVFPDGIPSHIQVEVIKKIDHTFHQVNEPCLLWSAAIKNPFSNSLRDLLASWILNATKHNHVAGTGSRN